ncbi:Lysophospholipid acyltransferase 2 [Mactra antiquata]
MFYFLGDAICNASGFGFNGYDKNGEPKWNLVTNVYIWGIEGATSFKLYVDNWNIQTALWLRHVCYDRIPIQKRFATFFLSALWHGCYPGYYFTFISGYPLSEAARKMRRKVRPYFQRTRWSQILYDIITCFSTHLMISYICVPFTVLHLKQTLIYFTYNMYWSLHIAILLTLVLVPYIPTLASEKPVKQNICNGDVSEESANLKPANLESKKSQ